VEGISIIKGRCVNHQRQVYQSSRAGVPLIRAGVPIINGRCTTHQGQVCQSSKAGVPIIKGRCTTHQGRCTNHQWQVYHSSGQVYQPSMAGVPIIAALCNSLEYFDMSTYMHLKRPISCCQPTDHCTLCWKTSCFTQQSIFTMDMCMCVCLFICDCASLSAGICVCVCVLVGAHVEGHTCQIYRPVLYGRLDECSVLCCMALSG